MNVSWLGGRKTEGARGILESLSSEHHVRVDLSVRKAKLRWRTPSVASPRRLRSLS